MNHHGRHRRSFNAPSHAHELTFTCYRRYPFLKAERTCSWLAEAINAARIRHDFALWAFVFMPDHVHLVILPRRPVYSMPEILKAIKAPVGREAIAYLESESSSWLARMTRRRGDETERLFWQSGGGYDRNIDEPTTLMSVLDYIHNNPVKRGLVDKASDWRWSSASWFEGSRDLCTLIPDRIPPDWVPVV